MSSDYLSHVSADAIPQNYPVSGRAERPSVLPLLAKLILMVGALAVFIPTWLSLVQLGSAQSWYGLRLLALSGIAGVVTLLVLILKQSINLLRVRAELT
jgi:hypothetical protein